MDTKIVVVSFVVNVDTDEKSFHDWLETCTFSHQTTVDFDFKGLPPTAVGIDLAASTTGADAFAYGAYGGSGSLAGIPAPATLMDSGVSDTVTDPAKVAEIDTALENFAEKQDDAVSGQSSEAEKQAPADEPAEEQKQQE